MISDLPLEFLPSRTLSFLEGADTCHDFRPACTVGVMSAVSTPRLCGDAKLAAMLFMQCAMGGFVGLEEVLLKLTHADDRQDCG